MRKDITDVSAALKNIVEILSIVNTSSGDYSFVSDPFEGLSVGSWDRRESFVLAREGE